MISGSGTRLFQPGDDPSPVLDWQPLRMAPSELLSARRRVHGVFLLGVLVYLIGTACSTAPPTGKAHIEDPRGSVFLQAFSDQSIQASHPINLDPALIARVLIGLQVQERERALQEMLAGSKATPVFSEEQVQFLAPRIAKALMTATAGEAVAFLVRSPRQNTGRLENSITETTAGSLYAYGLSLYVTLSQYRYAPAQTTTDSATHLRLLDSSGLANRTLHFTPSAAQRSDSFHRPTVGASTDKVLAIDYQLLQQVSPSVAVSDQTAPPVDRVVAPTREPLPGTKVSGASSQTTESLAQREAEINTLKDLVIKKDLELETLRRELQSIRKQLDSQTTGQDSPKRKAPPPAKPQQTTP
jgi:uncharacterized coiled-coil protein SlyX